MILHINVLHSSMVFRVFRQCDGPLVVSMDGDIVKITTNTAKLFQEAA